LPSRLKVAVPVSLSNIFRFSP